MTQIQLEEIKLIGISLGRKTTNENGQSSRDCGSLWQKFQSGDYENKIPGKLTNEVFAVYHQYDGDFRKPFSYFIGCKVDPETETPDGMNNLIIPKGIYQKVIAQGKMPDCIVNVWKEIWSSDLKRAYKVDFEVYDEKSKDWNNAEVNVFLSVL